jgi:KipI family sensor histidine kinase inhibitor
VGELQVLNLTMRIEPLGDSAFVVSGMRDPAYRLAELLLSSNHPKILDANASYETLGIYTTPGGLTIPEIERLLSQTPETETREPITHQIPVLYDGPDAEGVTTLLGLTHKDLIQIHSGARYQCFAVGFCPGFPYLGWLDEKLQGTTRKPTPRKRIETGSVAITGKQTAIYPLPRPGGWNLIGRTPLTIVDVEDNYFPICAGDFVKFRAIDEAEFEKLKGERL